VPSCLRIAFTIETAEVDMSFEEMLRDRRGAEPLDPVRWIDLEVLHSRWRADEEIRRLRRSNRALAALPLVIVVATGALIVAERALG
jgi:hypothetical protein